MPATNTSGPAATYTRGSTNPSWCVNAYENDRSVASQHSLGSLENIRGNPTKVRFTSTCSHKTLVLCYPEPDGKGSVKEAKFDVGSTDEFNTMDRS
ncbi:uncharacterized protein B0T15DRAFT_497803 [Chaetomium strumarium]|uniref:Uncharacterized protein n=1 Tax=Chaetomium strumarium TaxID=1170767 RepID=A0AAJ0H0Z5_9PEZI|nr:hypothetical protein B0T15DRAFT_497803 [Chaetomium strumarium]